MNKAKTPIMTAVLAAIYAVIAQIVIPFPAVPLTLQCFAVALGAFVFGWKTSIASVMLYIGIGAVGLPVFAGFRGGADALLGPTGGFIWGFIILGLACGIAANKSRAVAIGFSLAGLVACNLLGALQFSLVTGSSFIASLLSASVPYLVKDAFLIWVAFGLATPISKAVLQRK